MDFNIPLYVPILLAALIAVPAGIWRLVVFINRKNQEAKDAEHERKQKARNEEKEARQKILSGFWLDVYNEITTGAPQYENGKVKYTYFYHNALNALEEVLKRPDCPWLTPEQAGVFTHELSSGCIESDTVIKVLQPKIQVSATVPESEKPATETEDWLNRSTGKAKTGRVLFIDEETRGGAALRQILRASKYSGLLADADVVIDQTGVIKNRYGPTFPREKVIVAAQPIKQGEAVGLRDIDGKMTQVYPQPMPSYDDLPEEAREPSSKPRIQRGQRVTVHQSDNFSYPALVDCVSPNGYAVWSEISGNRCHVAAEDIQPIDQEYQWELERYSYCGLTFKKEIEASDYDPSLPNLFTVSMMGDSRPDLRKAQAILDYLIKNCTHSGIHTFYEMKNKVSRKLYQINISRMTTDELADTYRIECDKMLEDGIYVGNDPAVMHEYSLKKDCFDELYAAVTKSGLPISSCCQRLTQDCECKVPSFEDNCKDIVNAIKEKGKNGENPSNV